MSILTTDEHQDIIQVLHVDDEPDQLTFVKLFLEREDPRLHIESVLTPEEALRRLDESFDCILSDYQMNKMDGIEFARKIRENNNIPFIIYTGRGSEEVAIAAFDAGVDDYVRKELDPGHYKILAKRIRRTVEKHPSVERYIESEKCLQAIKEDLLCNSDCRPGENHHNIESLGSKAGLFQQSRDPIDDLNKFTHRNETIEDSNIFKEMSKEKLYSQQIEKYIIRKNSQIWGNLSALSTLLDDVHAPQFTINMTGRTTGCVPVGEPIRKAEEKLQGILSTLNEDIKLAEFNGMIRDGNVSRALSYKKICADKIETLYNNLLWS